MNISCTYTSVYIHMCIYIYIYIYIYTNVDIIIWGDGEAQVFVGFGPWQRPSLCGPWLSHGPSADKAM